MGSISARTYKCPVAIDLFCSLVEERVCRPTFFSPGVIS